MSRKLPGPVPIEQINDLRTPLSLLQTRRSVLARMMVEPGPDEAEISQLLEIGVRVPDHGKLCPWRFIVIKGKGRDKIGDVIASRWAELNSDHGAETIEQQRQTFLRAPLVIAVVSSVSDTQKIPAWEQELSAGAVCQNILTAATALGFVGQWITGWYAYDKAVLQALSLQEHEKIAGYIYIGSSIEKPTDRPRPDHRELVTYWNG